MSGAGAATLTVFVPFLMTMTAATAALTAAMPTPTPPARTMTTAALPFAMTGTTAATTRSRRAVGNQEHFPLLELFQRRLHARRFGQENLNPLLPQVTKYRTGNRRTGQRIKRHHRAVFLFQRHEIDFLGLAAFQVDDVQIADIRLGRLRAG